MVIAKNVFQLTQLADASYASLDRFSDIQTALKNTNEELGAKMDFSAAQAEILDTTWSVVPGAHRPNTESGFSATLFRIGADFFHLASNSLSGGAPCLR